MSLIINSSWRTCVCGFVVILTLGVTFCGVPDEVTHSHPHEPAEPDRVQAETARPVVETRWTQLSELFVEYPQLVLDQTSRFAIHFTDLSTFEPIRGGRVIVYLIGDQNEEFVVEAPSRPGFFDVAVTPSTAGSYRLEVELDSLELRDRHDLGNVMVRTETEVSVLAEAEDPAHISIPFLKEQQWTLDFATALAERSQMAKSLVLSAEIEPRTGGSVDVTAPVAGRLVNDISIRPVGSHVDRGEKLAEVIPHSGHGEDRPALQLDVAEARDALELARAGRARVERLVEVGALPERRQLEARVAVQTAESRVLAAEARLAQLDEMRRGEESEGGRDMGFVLRAPMSGVVAKADATPGASVEQGVLLFKLVTLDRVHIVGALPEAELSRADELVGAELDMPGGGTPVALNRLISIGRILDSNTRTVPIVYELSAPDRRFAIGQAVSLRVFVSESTEAVTVPESAIVDDAGQSVIFVQVSGESFDRRVVQLGNRESGRVQISGDINVGERIVIRGAPLIRLATLSSQVPVHIH